MGYIKRVRCFFMNEAGKTYEISKEEAVKQLKKVVYELDNLDIKNALNEQDA